MKPFDVNIGLVSLLSSFLPGAVLVAILLYVEAEHPGWFSVRPLYRFMLDDATVVPFWAVFLLAAFGSGYFVNSSASSLDIFYDRIRRVIYPYRSDLRRWMERKGATFDGDFGEASRQYCGQLAPRLLHFFFQLNMQLRVDSSQHSAEQLLRTHAAEVLPASNSFKWAMTLLEVYFPTAALNANRMLATSKFFRSIMLVSAIVFGLQFLGLLPGTLALLPVNGLVLILSFREYVVQRHKSTQLAYRSIVTLYHTPPRIVELTAD